MSVDAQRMVDETRQEVCRLFNAPAPERVIFTLNCTDSLNMALKGLIKSGDRVVTGPYEHNSVTRPLYSLRRAGAQVAVAKSTKTFGSDVGIEGIDVLEVQLQQVAVVIGHPAAQRFA